VEPVDNTLSGRHRVYRESDNLQPAGVCGTCVVSIGPVAPADDVNLQLNNSNSNNNNNNNNN